ncbi:MAG: hypothetical protein FIB01_05765 [Gemmatimonadetes bacterium]|nr:hypothetical protein [Gemmatimonadota bacterium]
MFRLRVLGGFSLEGPPGTAAFPIRQRRAGAVMAVLAECGDLGCSRERLMALLWPESDEARARQALRSTIHLVRQALGPDAVLSAGELLRLNADVVGSDVQSFTHGLAVGRLIEAVHSYGGLLLDGFHVDDAPDFERWLDAERARLARECIEALERLAQGAEAVGAWGEAAGWWAQAVEQDPLNSHFVLRHVRALAAHGDRANAVKAAEVHERRLREELDMDVDAELLAAIDEVRRGDPAAPVARQDRGIRKPSISPPTPTGSPPHPDLAQTPAAKATAAPARPPRPPARHRRIAAVAAIAVVVVVAAGLLATSLIGRKPAASPLDPTAIAVLPFHVVGGDSASPARVLARYMGTLFELKVTGEFGRRIRHPGSVAERFRAAGGTLDTMISEDAELAVARSVRAGRLVRGTVVTMGDSLVLSASMLDVATGAVRGPPVRAEGTIARQQELVDRLIILLLARDAGISPESAPPLPHYKPEAIQAFLAGNAAPSFSAQMPFYHAALAADSNLVDAALMAYAVGESAQDSAELRYAWDHQDRLTERNRAYLQVLAAGRRGSIRTEAEKIAGHEALAARWPEWRGPWGEIGDQLTNFGALASIPDWSRRARQAFGQMDRRGDWVFWHLTELAFFDGDTARARLAIDSLAAKTSPRSDVVRHLPAYRWRLAVLRGDDKEAARLLGAVTDVNGVLQGALTDGRGISRALDRLAPRAPALTAIWGWARGDERMWREAWHRNGSPAGGISDATAPIFWALLLGPAQDTIAATALRRLEQVAVGTPAPADPDEQALARSWLVLWRLEHDDTTGARATGRWLDGDEDRRHRFAGWSRLIDVFLTQAEGGDVHAALLRMDSVVRELPLPTGYLRWDPLPAEVHNLTLARMLPRYGEPELGLAAARRRTFRAVGNYPDALPEYLREEGRLAALLGDRTGASRAYRHYLALRENPDPLWRASWDSVRAELAALTTR